MDINDLISSFFYTGKVKYAPGTFTSFITILIVIVLIIIKTPLIIYPIITLIILIIGTFFSHKSEKKSGEKDPGWITIDEAAGMFLSIIGINFFELTFLQNVVLIILAFTFFRFLDIYKPFPIRQLQKINGGIGIMIDDAIAGIFTNILIRLFFYIIFKRILTIC